MRLCISIAKINAFHFIKQNQRFFLKPLIKSCLRPAEFNEVLISIVRIRTYNFELFSQNLAKSRFFPYILPYYRLIFRLFTKNNKLLSKHTYYWPKKSKRYSIIRRNLMYSPLKLRLIMPRFPRKIK